MSAGLILRGTEALHLTPLISIVMIFSWAGPP